MSATFAITLGLILTSLLIGLDIYFAVDDVPGNTWSEIIRSWSKVTPIVPWVCGVLSGHLFHPFDNLKPLFGQPHSIAVLVWTSFVLLFLGLTFNKYGFEPASAAITFGCAFVIGSVLWPV
jgi:hypothetical protein